MVEDPPSSSKTLLNVESTVTSAYRLVLAPSVQRTGYEPNVATTVSHFDEKTDLDDGLTMATRYLQRQERANSHDGCKVLPPMSADVQLTVPCMIPNEV